MKVIKKLFLLALGFVLSFSAFAAVQTRVTGDALKSKLAEYDELIAKKRTSNSIVSAFGWTICKSLLTADINSMADVLANEAKVLATFTQDEQTKIVKYFVPGNATASYASIHWLFPSLNKEAVKFYDAKGCSYQVCYYLLNSDIKSLSLTDKEAFDLYSKYLPEIKSNNPTEIQKLLNSYIDFCSKVDDNSAAKTTLKKLNIIYTKKLIEDKAKWEPVVALIRTTLEVL